MIYLPSPRYSAEKLRKDIEDLPAAREKLEKKKEELKGQRCIEVAATASQLELRSLFCLHPAYQYSATP
jgi:hypothetical protein